MSDGKRLGTSRAAVYMRNKRKLKRLFSTCGTKVSIPKNFFDTMSSKFVSIFKRISRNKCQKNIGLVIHNYGFINF